MISFIVSCYSRPEYLNCCLASLKLQNPAGEILVTLNHPDESMTLAHKLVCEYFDVRWLETGKMGATCCYSAAELAVSHTNGDWLSFPSDDSYFHPRCSELMLKCAEENDLDLVYCDTLYSRPDADYGPYVLSTVAALNRIDKTSFFVKRRWFQEFPEKHPPVGSRADGYFIEALLRRGIKHGKVIKPRGLDGKHPVLVVHN